MPIITIDGNIGAGKTSVLNYLHTNFNINVDLEPINKWKSYLDNIYLNKKNFFNFQVRVWLDRSWIQEKDERSLIIMERSPNFIRNTFNKYMYEKELITSNENIIINELYNKTDIIWNSNYYIYLRSSPERCLERIHKRGRENEMDITFEYLEDIHKLHENCVEELINENKNVCIIDVEGKSLEEIANEIINYLNEL